MEVYFKELISKEASLEKLVEDLEKVVQGTDDFARSLGESLEPDSEIARRLRGLKDKCRLMKAEIVTRAQATDRLVRKNPYSFVAAAALLGIATGFAMRQVGKRAAASD